MSNTDIYAGMGYTFKDGSLFETAITHSSYTREVEGPLYESNERLEFLGDAYLDAIISRELYDRLPEENEGMMTKYRAMIVCGQSLAEVAKKLDLGSVIRLGKGEENTGGRERESIIANAVEAVIAAICLDGGYEEAKKFVLTHFEDRIEDVLEGRVKSDYKSELQEVWQETGPVEINYELTGEEGPDHDKVFYVRVIVQGKELGRGSGKSKKEAEQNAARQALMPGDK